MSETANNNEPGKYHALVLCRRLFWLTLLIYLPMMLLTQQLFPGKNALIVSFLVWVAMLVAGALAVALSRCPACGETFHMNGMTFLPVRSCLHCGVHLKELAKESP